MTTTKSSRRALVTGGAGLIGSHLTDLLVREGWRGMVEQIFQPLGPREISGILPRGGTILGSSRTNPFKIDGGVEKIRANLYVEARF